MVFVQNLVQLRDWLQRTKQRRNIGVLAIQKTINYVTGRPIVFEHVLERTVRPEFARDKRSRHDRKRSENRVQRNIKQH